MILTDQYRIADAIAEARTAMRLMPYLKSLNQVANDLQGSANVGRSLSLFGLEEWAQAYAQESYLPYWAGSHLFLADRYQGEFNKNSALLQGFLADPTVFGSSPRLQSLVQVPGFYARAIYGYAYSKSITLSSPILRVNGLSDVGGMPVAYIVDGELQSFGHPETNQPSDRGRNVTAGVGVRPTSELGLFLYGFNGREDDHFLESGFEFTQRQHTSNVNVGAHYRFSPTSQLWLRAGRLNHGHEDEGTFQLEPFTATLTHRQPEYGLRHTFDAGRHPGHLGPRAGAQAAGRLVRHGALRGRDDRHHAPVRRALAQRLRFRHGRDHATPALAGRRVVAGEPAHPRQRHDRPARRHRRRRSGELRGPGPAQGHGPRGRALPDH
jgi:hypothetical protein